MGAEYQPDQWLVIKIITPDETIFKVLGSWYGGFTTGNSWRMNSGIETVEDHDDYYVFVGYSGSRYKCFKDNYGSHMVASSIAEEMRRQPNIEIDVLTEDTNFSELLS